MRFDWLMVCALLVGCGGDGGSDTGASGDDDDAVVTSPTTSDGGCRDPSVNPLAGTCVETFLAGCFDPQGECTGERQGMTGLTLTWANGAQVVQDGLVTTLVASDGTTCATAETTLGGDCFSTTTYTRTSDGATMAYCISADGSMSVTCEDGTTFDITAEQAQAGQGCEYGGSETCVIE